MLAIERLKNGRSTGPGRIPAELNKNGTKKLYEHIKILFQRCFNGDPLPSDRKTSWVIPIPKKGPKDQCSNYRGISVTATMSRL